MRVSLGLGFAAALVALVAVSANVPAQTTRPSAAATNATAAIVAAAQKFVATLDDAGKAKVQFASDSPQKTKWSNLPIGIFPRQGVRMGDLTAPQREAALALLSTAFSQDGYRKIMDIVRGDEMLKTGASGQGQGPAPGRGGRGPGGVSFGEAEYYLAFVGTPSVSTQWTLQFGGHHLGVNLTIAGGRGTVAPSHTGAQPATFTFEGRTIRPLGDENDRAFALMGALDAARRDQAVLKFSVSDLVLGPGQDGRTIQPEGLKASAMTAAQQSMLLEIVREWAGIANDALAAPRMEQIRATLPETYFAWSGPVTPGSVAYFRIQGPTLVIEYAPQRNVDHIHTIYRDPTNDYGAGFARQ